MHDRIQLASAVFTAFTQTGPLAASAFASGTVAASADSHLIYYNSATGRLFYDTNGAAAGGDVQFTLLAHDLSLTDADFFYRVDVASKR